MKVSSQGLREVENWLSPSEAGEVLGTSGQWVTKLARRGDLDAIRTSLGWLVNPADVDRLSRERVEKAERRLSAMRSARTANSARTGGARRGGRLASNG